MTFLRALDILTDILIWAGAAAALVQMVRKGRHGRWHMIAYGTAVILWSVEMIATNDRPQWFDSGLMMFWTLAIVSRFKHGANDGRDAEHRRTDRAQPESN